MPRATTKEGLINDAKENYKKLNLLISKLNEEELNTSLRVASASSKLGKFKPKGCR